MVAARREVVDVVNADSSETAGPDSAHPKTASDKTMGASKATKKGSSMYKLDEGRSPFTDLAIGVLPQLETATGQKDYKRVSGLLQILHSICKR